MNEMKDQNNQLQQKDIDYLAKEVSSLKSEMTTGFALIHNKLEMFNENYVKRKELDELFEGRDEKIDEIRSTIKWVVRTVIAIIISAVMGSIILIK